MTKITMVLTEHTYAKLKVLAGDKEDFRDGFLDEKEHAAAAASAATTLLEWAIRGLYGANGPAPFRCPLTLEARTEETNNA